MFGAAGHRRQMARARRRAGPATGGTGPLGFARYRSQPWLLRMAVEQSMELAWPEMVLPSGP
ncbi:MAG: hypothetical protein ACLGIO_08745, partial [Acidimicrobiia bacterium]